jgi:hypothetical protein
MLPTARPPLSARTAILRRVAVAVIPVALLFLPAAAYGANENRPVAGRWCGLAAGGGIVNLEVSLDGRWVESIQIMNERGQVSSGEGARTGRIQIVQDRFIYRAGGGSGGRCDRAPCRDGGAGNQVMIRGHFEGPDAVRGSFTGPNFGPGERRAVGNYIAWPAELAPCPYGP